MDEDEQTREEHSNMQAITASLSAAQISHQMMHEQEEFEIFIASQTKAFEDRMTGYRTVLVQPSNSLVVFRAIGTRKKRGRCRCRVSLKKKGLRRWYDLRGKRRKHNPERKSKWRRARSDPTRNENEGESQWTIESRAKQRETA
ncbi:hypothetical protein FRB91_011419 [Serendipita sp. 411]|nr:hypothetical protein FRC18_011225 [Serendipita sp. 400]KAG8847786.1 hypothetical protein FRB91_011419 [Serendipita sp. 411]